MNAIILIDKIVENTGDTQHNHRISKQAERVVAQLLEDRVPTKVHRPLSRSDRQKRMLSRLLGEATGNGINSKMIDQKDKGDSATEEDSELMDKTDQGDSATAEDSEMMDDSPETADPTDPTKANIKKSKTGKKPAGNKSTDSSGADSSSEVRSPTSTDVRSPTSTDVRSPTKTSTSTDAYTARNITVTGGAGDGDTIVHVHADHEDEHDTPNSGGDHEEQV